MSPPLCRTRPKTPGVVTLGTPTCCWARLIDSMAITAPASSNSASKTFLVWATPISSTERTPPKKSMRWMASPAATISSTATAVMTRSTASAAMTISSAARVPIFSTAAQVTTRRATSPPQLASLRASPPARGPAATRKATPTSASRISSALRTTMRSPATTATTRCPDCPATTSSTAGTAWRRRRRHHEQRFRTPELLVEHGIRRAMNVILQGDGSAYGVLEVDSRSEGEFTEHDIAFLQGAANILGMAIEQQQYQRKLQAALDRHQILLKEMNHRIKNSLQVVSSMLQLQAGTVGDAALSDRLNEASARISTVGRAYERLAYN